MGRKPEQVEREAAELGLLVKPDWAGRRSLSVADARGLASGEARRNLEHDRGWQAHLQACKTWREGRDRAIREAAKKVRAVARRGVPHSGALAADAQRAATNAAEHYERTVPRPRFNGTTAAPLEYISPEEALA
ncbi:MAG: hypothetical protein ABW156_02220 [Jiangellaceae bacterium]